MMDSAKGVFNIREIGKIIDKRYGFQLVCIHSIVTTFANVGPFCRAHVIQTLQPMLGEGAVKRALRAMIESGMIEIVQKTQARQGVNGAVMKISDPSNWGPSNKATTSLH